jgi:uncharacterized membrane protein (DUF441 family)
MKIFRKESPKPLKTSVIVRVKVLVAFLSPNGMTVHSNNPLLVTSAVFPMSSRAILICQNPDYTSSAVNHVNLPI